MVLVKLYHPGSQGNIRSHKFETLGAGVTVTGTTFSNQLSVSGVATATSFIKFGGTSSQYLMAMDQVTTASGGSGIGNVSEDTTPQLGGELRYSMVTQFISGINELSVLLTFSTKKWNKVLMVLVIIPSLDLKCNWNC